MIVVRRFMHLSENEADYLDPKLALLPKQENAIPRLKIFCLKMLESSIFETISMILISLYTIFILFWLTFADIFNI